MKTRLAALALTAATAATLTACSGSGGSTSDAGGATPTTGVISSPTAQTTPTPSPQPAGAEGACSLIDQSTASQIAGTSMPAGKGEANVGDDDGMSKLDGCTYQGDGVKIGYDVVAFKGVSPDQLLTMAKAKAKAAAAQGGMVKTFEPALPGALGFTLSLPKGVNSQITAVSDIYLVTVAVARTDKDAATSQDQATQAAQAILGNL